MKKFNNYEKYDNLNIHKKYNIHKIETLFNDIVNILKFFENFIKIIKKEIKNNSSKSDMGLNIDNFICLSILYNK